MFGKLAYDRNKAMVEADHRVLIREAALDVTDGTEPDDKIQMNELDSVIASDAYAVSKEELADLEAKIGDIAENKAGKDITTMTKNEIEQHVASNAGSWTISHLNE